MRWTDVSQARGQRERSSANGRESAPARKDGKMERMMMAGSLLLQVWGLIQVAETMDKSQFVAPGPHNVQVHHIIGHTRDSRDTK